MTLSKSLPTACGDLLRTFRSISIHCSFLAVVAGTRIRVKKKTFDELLSSSQQLYVATMVIYEETKQTNGVLDSANLSKLQAYRHSTV